MLAGAHPTLVVEKILRHATVGVAALLSHTPASAPKQI